MKFPLLLAATLVAFHAARADEPAAIKFPAEQTAWNAVVARFGTTPEVKPGPKTTEYGVQGKGSASIQVDKASGHVVVFVSNGANFTDEEFKYFAAFSELNNLTLWHNSGFTGTGLSQLAALSKLERITLAGGTLDDTGLAALAKLPALKEFRAWHDRFSDTGVAALSKHPTLESITLGPNWQPMVTDKSVVALATCPKLREFSISETWLTWESGLQQLAQRKETLTKLDLGDSIVDPADLKRLEAALPKTKIVTKGPAATAEALQKPQVRAIVEKWVPKEVVARVVAAKAP